MGDRPADFVYEDSRRLQIAMPEVMVGVVLDDIHEYGSVMFRVPRQMQIDFRINISGHGVLLGQQKRREKPVRSGLPVEG